jgi:hypothetical protein
MFERMGYLSYCGWKVHKEYGSVRPMFLPLDTVRRQRSLGSPLWEPIGRHVAVGEFGGYELIHEHADPEPLPMMAEVGA